MPWAMYVSKMFYKLIQHKRDQWLASGQSVVADVIGYMERRGMLRDAQVEAIKTYLFLKIACKGQPLWQLFAEGMFCIPDDDACSPGHTPDSVAKAGPAAVALYQYSRQTDRNGHQVSAELERLVGRGMTDADCRQVLRDMFYGISYADYLFSLPMGAGKTFLMAAFIYIDLYFALNEPDNPVWGHNFLILAPSGLKSSVVPSLRGIREFDPSWVFPPSTAARLRSVVRFEVLDEQRNSRRGNVVRNPNAHKINQYVATGDSLGLVAVTNAEKVILDRIDDNDRDLNLLSADEKKRLAVANELRMVIGRLPQLSVFIDEVHHASSTEIRLRQVVTRWAAVSPSFCGVLGFSGTPYLEKAERVSVAGKLGVRCTDISNVVYYYPLIDGVDNFLKRPEVKFADNDMLTIVNNGVREFLDRYRDTVYGNGTCAKLAIYCGQIATLEDDIYPLVASIVTEYGMNPTEAVLKRHKGSKAQKAGGRAYQEPEGSEAAFAALDSPLSNVRIVLLVQIGKEGWDCKSLTGIILPHEGACKKNMVLQTSCRCLRQVVRGEHETALVWMNKPNADSLNKELQQQQNITLHQLNGLRPAARQPLARHSRAAALRVPPVDFYQLKVSYATKVADGAADTASRLAVESVVARAAESLATIQDLNGRTIGYDKLLKEGGESISYQWWLHKIARESIGTLSVADLRCYDELLHKVFMHVTTGSGAVRTESPDYDQEQTRCNIRRAFSPRRTLDVVEEIVPDTASLMAVEGGDMPLPQHGRRLYPPADAVSEILRWDVSADGVDGTAGRDGADAVDPHPERANTYHYLPYMFGDDSEFEYFRKALIPIVSGSNIECYYNGDDTLTGFRIRCYRRSSGRWTYDGCYVPDFVMIRRDGQGGIERLCMIETRGGDFACKNRERIDFVSKVFVPKNNEMFHNERFRFMSVRPSESVRKQTEQTLRMIDDFFNHTDKR